MGVYLSTPRTQKVTEGGENEMLRYGLSSMQGWRATMEDAHAAYSNFDDSTSFFGVYDGHGGKDVAKFCSKFLHQQVLEYEAQGNDDLATSVQKAFLRMDKMMCDKPGQKELELLRGKMDQSGSNAEGLTEKEYAGLIDNWKSEGIYTAQGPLSSGCTACVAIIRKDHILVANAGDSRCVLSRNGQAQNLSTDHKPHLADEKQRIEDAGGFVQFGRVNGSLNLSRAIGDMQMKRNKTLPADKQLITANPEIVTVKLSEDVEFLIIACDGIWDCMTSQRAVDFVREQLNNENNLSLVCEKVLDECLAPASGGEGCDNMTMILVQFKKPLNAEPSSHPEQQAGSSTQ